MRSCILLLICLVNVSISRTALGQSLRHTIALPYAGLSAYSVQQADPLSFTANQAALSNIKQAGIGLYTEQRFLIDALNAYCLALAMPTVHGNFGVQLNFSGFKNFNETSIGIAYAKTLGRKVDIGVQFNYYGYHIPGYNNASAITAEAGMIIHFTEKLNGGIHVYNPAGGTLRNAAVNEKLASAYKFGLGYDASENFFVSGEIVKEEDNPVNIIAGVQYHFAKQFFARLGFSSVSSAIFAGAGLGWKNLRLDVGGSYQQQLGFSPGVLLIANFGSKKS